MLSQAKDRGAGNLSGVWTLLLQSARQPVVRKEPYNCSFGHHACSLLLPPVLAHCPHGQLRHPVVHHASIEARTGSKDRQQF